PRDTIRIARLAQQCGLFPVIEAEGGQVVGVSTIRRPVPVEEYLRLQGRFAHLFAPDGTVAAPEIVAHIQAIADRNIERYGLLELPAETGARP
ncbi:MAG: hypothetical protein WBG41_14825, partial [Acidimicrobiales bacterium]